MLKKVYYLVLLKEMYKKLNMELKDLAEKKGATESGGRKAQGYTRVMKEQDNITTEYDGLKSEVLDWLKSTYSAHKHTEKLRCKLKYFDSISRSDFQSVIDSLYPPNTITHKDEGKIAHIYKASNLMQEIYTSCLHELEGR